MINLGIEVKMECSPYIIIFSHICIVFTNGCVAPTYKKPSTNSLQISAVKEPGQVMHWLKNVNKMNAGDIQLLKRYILSYGAVVIKGQNITKEQQINFSKSIGTTIELPKSFYMTGDGIKGNVTVVPVSNYWDNGTWKGSKYTYGQYWHKDMNFLPEDQARVFSILYAKEYKQGNNGGTTGFIDACKARSELPNSLAKHILGVKFKFGANLVDDFQEALKMDLDYYPTVERSIIFPHPIRKCECLNMAETKCGFLLFNAKQESLKAVEDAWIWVQNRPFYQHIWSQGDIVVWDNFAVFHRLLPYTDKGKKRVFARTYSRPNF